MPRVAEKPHQIGQYFGERRLARDRESILTAVGYVSPVVARRMETADTALPHLLANPPGPCPRIAEGGA